MEKLLDKDFCLVIPPFGATWLCTITKNDFHNWVTKKHQLCIHDVRGINLIPQQTQAGENVVLVNITNPYPGDTKQTEIYLDQAIVEIIGRIGEDAARNEVCPEHPTLFLNYKEAIKAWRAARSDISMPTPEEVRAVNQNNVTPFRKN